MDRRSCEMRARRRPEAGREVERTSRPAIAVEPENHGIVRKLPPPHSPHRKGECGLPGPGLAAECEHAFRSYRCSSMEGLPTQSLQYQRLYDTGKCLDDYPG